MYSVGFNPSNDPTTGYRATWTTAIQPFWAIGIYFIVMLVVRVLLTTVGLYKVFRAGTVDVIPLHPDKVGGLRPLQNYALMLSLMLAMFGIGIGVGFFAVVLPGEAGTGTFVDSERIAQSPQLWFAFFAYFVLVPLTFFGTLGSAHGPMAKAKDARLQDLSKQFKRDLDYVQKNIGENGDSIKARFERLERVQKLYAMTNSFPVWPFDLASLRRFAAIWASPLLAFSPIAIQVLLKRFGVL